MKLPSLKVCVCAFAVLCSFPLATRAEAGDKVLILNAAADTADATRLNIQGVFGDLPPYAPIVALGTTMLNVISVSPTQIVAIIPAGTAPGSYLLTVSRAKK